MGLNVVMMGPPGAGKGTQAARLARQRGVPKISTGDMLRDGIRDGNSVALEAKALMDMGQLVDDRTMIAIVQERLSRSDTAHGFVLDGFPRTVPQAEALDAMLDARGQKLDAAVAMSVPEDELVRRLSARRECPVCQRAYNLETAAPRDGRHCDDHPSAELVQRADDSESTVRRRLEQYWSKTAPLIGWYRESGRLREVPGLGPLDDVYRSLTQALGCRA